MPADRRQQGLVLDMNVHENLMLPRSALGRPFQWTRGDEELQDTHRTIAELQVKTPHAFMRIGNLSGGNQQKVVLGRWLLQNPKLLVLDEPTNGVDVGAKAEIYMLMSRMLEQGTGILLISSELPELLALSDRVLVMYRGRIVREFGRGADQQEVAYYANGNV